jgi:hypothetical protein
MNKLTDFLGWHAAQKGMTREEFSAYFLSEGNNIKSFDEFAGPANEEAINAGPESEVVIDDLITTDGTEISSEEILGIIVSSDNEKQVEDKMYDKFGQTSFSEEDMSTIKTYYNEYSTENKEEELEKEKEAEEGGEGEGGGGDDPLGDI